MAKDKNIERLLLRGGICSWVVIPGPPTWEFIVFGKTPRNLPRPSQRHHPDFLHEAEMLVDPEAGKQRCVLSGLARTQVPDTRAPAHGEGVQIIAVHASIKEPVAGAIKEA